MKRKISLPLILGICLLIGSIVVFALLQLSAHLGRQQCSRVLLQLDEILQEKVPGVPGSLSGGMPVLQVEGLDYAALLEIPAFGVRLPVADGWNSQKLLFGPARFYGSAYEGTLVIGGADAAGQFDFCDRIGHDAVLTLTDMTGARLSYSVTRIDRTKHAESTWLASEEFDLTLFCRDAYTMEYIAVRCNYSYK